MKSKLHLKKQNKRKIIKKSKKYKVLVKGKNNIFTKNNFKFIDVQADGNCLFHALFKTLVDDMSNEERDFNDGYQLRRNIVDYIKKNSEFFIPGIKFFLQNDILLKARNQNNKNKVRKIEDILSQGDDAILEYYTNWMEKSDTYGGNLEIIAFRRMRNVNVRVYTISNGKLDFSTPSDDYDPSLKPVNLFHHGDFEHYSALLPINTENQTNTNNEIKPNKNKSKKQPKKVEPKKIKTKKVEPKKVEPKKVEPEKVKPRKVETKKVKPRKVEHKKVKPRKVEPKNDELNKLLKTVDLKLINYKKRSNYHLKKYGQIPEKYNRKTKRHEQLKEEIIKFINDKKNPSKENTTKFENKLKNINVDIEKEIVKKTDNTKLKEKLGKILQKCDDKLKNYKKRQNYYQKTKQEFPKIKYTRKTKRYQSIKNEILNIKRNKIKITKKLIDDLTKKLNEKKR